MSITINGVKPGTATLTMRLAPSRLMRPSPCGSTCDGGFRMPATMFGVTYADAHLSVRLYKTD